MAIKEILGDLYDKFLTICVILLTGKNNIKKMPIFDGAPDSGKTILLEILEAFVGKFTSIHEKIARRYSWYCKKNNQMPCPNHFEKNEEWKKTLLTKDNMDRFLITVIDYAKSGVKKPLLDMSTAEKTHLFEIIGDLVGHFKENNMYQNEDQYCLPNDVFDAFDKFRKNDIHKEFTPQKFAKVLGIGSKSKK